MKEITKEKIQRILEDYKQGLSMKQCAAKYDVSKSTVARYIHLLAPSDVRKKSLCFTLANVSDDELKEKALNASSILDLCKSLGLNSVSQKHRVYLKQRFLQMNLRIPYMFARTALGEDITKGDIDAKYDNWWASNVRIRKKARAAYLKSDKPKCCAICGYNKCIEIAHIKPVSEFSEDTKLTEINDLSNLVALCPNHHWEFDHGMLDIEQIRKIKS